MNEEKKRKTIILTFIGALTLSFVVVGGTYAYFQIVNTDDGNTSTDFETQTDELNKYGTPLLTKKSDLYISLSASDMSYSNCGKSYWATVVADPQNTNYETERKNHVISTASIERPEGESVVEDAYLKCTSELTITITGSMKDVLETGDGKLYLGAKSSDGNSGSITPESFDLAELVSKQESGENKVTVNYGITGYTSVDVTADIEIVNREDIQNSLAGTKITITITNTNLSCSVSEKPITPLELVASNPQRLSQDPVGGMHRYQGLATDEINNYICLGDNCCKTAECDADDNDDMYRIIGITQSGEMKVIKKTALTDAVAWRDSIYYDIKWPQSLIYQKLNGNGDTDPDSFYSQINERTKPYVIKKEWLYGDAVTNSGFSYQGDVVYKYENGEYKEKGAINAYIGLMYISDYYYAYPGGNPRNENVAKTSWIFLGNNETSHPASHPDRFGGYEWVVSRYGYNGSRVYIGYCIHSDGTVQSISLEYELALRPTFFLSSTVELEGEGSLTNPFTVKQLTTE